MQWMLVVRTHDGWEEADDAGYDNRFDDPESAREEIDWLRGLGEPWASQTFEVRLVPVESSTASTGRLVRIERRFEAGPEAAR